MTPDQQGWLENDKKSKYLFITCYFVDI